MPGRPLVIAHRGASAYAPENTLAAFELAVEQGADLLEFDVHLSADDQPVVIHDETLRRTTSGTGRVRDHSLRELKRLDAGGWWHRRFRGQRLQSLQEVLERFRARIGFAVELKAGSAVYPGIEDRVVSLLEIYDVVDRALVLSFDHPALATVARANAELPRVALIGPRARLPETITAVVPPGATAVGLPARLASEQRVRAAREASLDLYIWTVNDPALMDSLITGQVRGIITDRPDVLRTRPRLT
jgi:glycerophosphoryl diester phosphodiesterase